MSIILNRHLFATYTFPASREKKILNPDKIPQKTPQIPRDLWFFSFTHLSLAHSELAPVWLSCYPEIIPILSTKNPVFHIFRHKNAFLSRKLHNFCSIFVAFSGFSDFCGLFSALGRDSCLKLDRIFLYFLLLYIYYIFYLFISHFLLFQQYTKIKNRFLLNSLILPQKISINFKSRNFLLN